MWPSEEAGEETDGQFSGALGSSLLASEYGLKIVRKVKTSPFSMLSFFASSLFMASSAHAIRARRIGRTFKTTQTTPPGSS
jgi:hypothetical protein